jgi:hypothetical protein
MMRRAAANLPVSCPARRCSSVYATWASILLAAVTALSPAHAGAARSTPATCTVSDTGTATIVLPSKSPRRRLTLEVTRAGTFGVHATVTRASQTVLTIDSVQSDGGALNATITFGHGFRRIGVLTLTSTDGQTFDGAIDGRALVPFTAGADPASLRFADGGKPPKLKLKRAVLQALRKLAKVDLKSCGTGTSAFQARALDIGCFIPGVECHDCESCSAACFTYNVVCQVSGTVTAAGCIIATAGVGAPVCVPTWMIAMGGCVKAWYECSVVCENDIDACNALPGERCSSSSTCGGDDQCCGGANNGGDCCQDQGNCCGKKCLENTSDFCADRDKGVVCHAGAGDVCNDARDPSACCPGETPACVAFGGDPRTLPEGGVCCRRDQVFAGGCCAPGDVCGETCCPSHVCINGSCCAPPEFAVCGGNCCPALTTTCCNGQCCAGVCVNNSLCCPRDRACGNVCCAEGSACVNPASGTCQACLPGLVPCEYAPGVPVCCPPGTECCNNGECCGAPNGQCCDFGEGPVCAITCLR